MDPNLPLNLVRSESGNTLYNVSAAKNCDYDFLYKIDEFQLVNQALQEIGFERMSGVFFEEKIDFSLYQKLDRIDIYDILKSYPVGVKRIFYDKYNEWIYSRQKSVSMSKPNSNQISVSLTEILNTEPGKAFKQSICEEKALSIKEQRGLSGLIVDFYTKNNLVMSREDMSRLSQEIKEFFPNENSEVFYCEGSQPKGFLYHKYRNTLYSLGASTSTKGKKRKLSTNLPENEIEEQSFPNEIRMSDDFIRTNSQLPLDKLIEHWKVTSKYRNHKIRTEKLNVSQIITIYKAYQRADGYMLISMDFKSIFSDIDFFLKFDETSSKLVNIIKSNSVNSLVLQRLSNTSNQTQSEKLLNILFGLHCIFYDGGKQKGSKSKLSINDTFKFLILIAKNEHTYQSEVEDFKKYLMDNNKTMQPLIIGFGSNFSDLKFDKFIVICDDLSFKFDNLMNALESLLHIFFVFDLKFPTPNEKVYNFLSVLFYNVNNINLDAKTKQLLKLVIE
ncbi:hypothetical protein PVAND_003012 [Polypedilum vanderplanki]|uniref:Uncharacterized protein n=1 Tax=Polypedilum vanderplanki TaxID=319348 RepID=A0A9J6BSS5_POLVA|nr:hypothetical protein PVAND_003012 [Polypedilum vanderplanki]